MRAESRIQLRPLVGAEHLLRARQQLHLFAAHVFQIKALVVAPLAHEDGAARRAQQLPGQQQVLQRAHPRLAGQVVVLELLHHRHQVRVVAQQRGKQQVGFLGVMLPLGKLVDVEQDGAHHIKEALRAFALRLRDQLIERAQHRRHAAVLVLDDGKGLGKHGRSFPCTRGLRLDAGQGRQRRSSSALVITLTLLSAMAAPATTGLR